MGNGEGGGDGNGTSEGGGMGDGGMGIGGNCSGNGAGAGSSIFIRVYFIRLRFSHVVTNEPGTCSLYSFMMAFPGLAREMPEKPSVASRPRSVCAVPNAGLGLAASKPLACV